jgi:hypothetical protein
MVLNHVDPRPISDNSSTIFSAKTPPETVADDDFLNDEDPFSNTESSSSSVPWPGSTFLIRCASSGHVITLLDGRIVLASPGNRGSIHWACVDTKGWLGFRSPISGRFLGYDAKGKLHCSAERQKEWENFCVRMRPDGGYILLMTHFERLWKVGTKVERGVEVLAKIGDGQDDGIVWEFVKV